MAAEDHPSELVSVDDTSAELAELEDQARDFARGSRSDATWRAYQSDLTHFEAWCASQRPMRAPLPALPTTVALYLAALAETHKASTLRRRLASISVAHQLASLPTPTSEPEVQTVFAGIRRARGTAPRKVRAARTEVIGRLVAPLQTRRLADVRDRAILLIGFAGALRRSELVAIDVDDVTEDDHGLRLVLRRSKTDQEAEGAVRGLPYGSNPSTCPVRAWRAWVTASGLDSGPAFRGINRHGQMSGTRLTDRSVARMIQRRATAVGLPGEFAGHSLRAGFATEAYSQGTPELAIMRHGRWRAASVMRGYVEEGSVWVDNAATHLGL